MLKKLRQFSALFFFAVLVRFGAGTALAIDPCDYEQAIAFCLYYQCGENNPPCMVQCLGMLDCVCHTQHTVEECLDIWS